MKTTHVSYHIIRTHKASTSYILRIFPHHIVLDSTTGSYHTCCSSVMVYIVHTPRQQLHLHQGAECGVYTIILQSTAVNILLRQLFISDPAGVVRIIIFIFRVVVYSACSSIVQQQQQQEYPMIPHDCCG